MTTITASAGIPSTGERSANPPMSPETTEIQAASARTIPALMAAVSAIVSANCGPAKSW